MKKVFITGGNGILGKYVIEQFTEYELLCPTRVKLDIIDKNKVKQFFQKHKPELVIHLAAKTNVDECEKDPRDAYLINSEGTKNIAEMCRDTNSSFLYVSTAAVFNGKKNCFYEDDIPDPINQYGKSKLQGEKYVESLLKNFVILRAGWMIGGGKKEKKFVSYIVDQVKTKKEIFVVNDTRGSITYAKELAETIKRLLGEKKTGIYHYASRGSCTRLEIAEKIVEMANADVKLVPVTSSYFKDSFFAPRLKNEIIGSRKLEYLYTWEESLKRYFDTELKNSL